MFNNNLSPKPLGRNNPRPEETSKANSHSIFDGKSQLFDYNLDKQWKRDPVIRREIEGIMKVGKPFKTVTYQAVSDKIDELQRRVDLNKDNRYTPSEVAQALKKEYWKSKEENAKHPSDVIGRVTRQKEDEFIRENFGGK